MSLLQWHEAPSIQNQDQLGILLMQLEELRLRWVAC